MSIFKNVIMLLTCLNTKYDVKVFKSHIHKSPFCNSGLIILAFSFVSLGKKRDKPQHSLS